MMPVGGNISKLRSFIDSNDDGNEWIYYSDANTDNNPNNAPWRLSTNGANGKKI